MAFNPSIPNSYDLSLEDTKIRDRYFKEYIGLTNLSGFMGETDNSPIHLAELNTGAGASYVFSLLAELDDEGYVGEFEQLQGNERDVNVYAQTVTTHRTRNAVKLQSPDIVRQRSPLKIYEALQPLVIRKQRRKLVRDILDAMTTGIYADNTSTTVTPSEHRVVYGEFGYDATANSIKTQCDKFSGATADKSGLSVDHIRKLQRYARMGGTTINQETPVTPVELKTRKGFAWENYILLIDPESYISLVKDPEWNQYQTSARSYVEDLPNGIDGARYKGQVEGVMIYECHELANYRIKSTSTSGTGTAGWNLLLGGNALGLVWSSRPQIITQHWDYDENIGIGIKEYRGQQALMFPSKKDKAKNIETGIIHSFTQIK